MLCVICAPSGAGKTTIIKEIFKNLPEMRFSVSATTRKIRNGEKNGKDYYFLSREIFEDMVQKDEFIEWEEVHGELYGTLKNELKKCADSSVDMIFDVDVKGAISIKRLYPDAVTIFIEAPKVEIIERLKNRKTESETQLQKRIQRIEFELKQKDKFDYVVDNQSAPGGLKKVVNEILNIIKKSKPVINTGEENK